MDRYGRTMTMADWIGLVVMFFCFCFGFCFAVVLMAMIGVF